MTSQRLSDEQIKEAFDKSVWIDASPHEWPTATEIPLLCNAVLDLTAERDRLRAELAALKEDAAMSASSLANTLTNTTEMLDDISALFPDDAAHKFGETTGVSLLDDVRDLMKRAEAAEAALAEEKARLDDVEKMKASITFRSLIGQWEVVPDEAHPAHRKYHTRKKLRAAIDAARGKS